MAKYTDKHTETTAVQVLPVWVYDKYGGIIFTYLWNEYLINSS